MESVEIIKNLIHEEAKNVHGGDYSKIFLGGFSQGGCLTFMIGIIFEEFLGGLAGMGGIPLPILKKMINEGTPESLAQMKW